MGLSSAHKFQRVCARQQSSVGANFLELIAGIVSLGRTLAAVTAGASGVLRAGKGTLLRALGLMGLTAMTVQGCGLTPPRMQPTLEMTEETVQFTAVPMSRAWVNFPTALVVIERGLRDSIEQRIGLPNTTTVQGDNSALLRARKPDGVGTGRLNYSEFMKRVGTPPLPFSDVKAGDLRTAEDTMGPYFWAEKRTGDGTICVLALRRMTTGMRQLPRNYTVLDVMLRNCVAGPLEEALAPITAPHIGFAYGVADDVPGGESRMLSPLAGPTPR